MHGGREMKTVGLSSPFLSLNSTTQPVLARMHLSSFCLSLCPASLSGVGGKTNPTASSSGL